MRFAVQIRPVLWTLNVSCKFDITRRAYVMADRTAVNAVFFGSWCNWRDTHVLGTCTTIHCGFESHRADCQCNAVYWSSATLWKAATEIWVKVPCVPGWFNKNAVVMEVQFFSLALSISIRLEKYSLESLWFQGFFVYLRCYGNIQEVI